MERAAEGGIFSREYPMARARTRQRAGPQHAFVWLEKMRFRGGHFRGELAQWRDVQNPRATTVSADDDIARCWVDGDFMHGHGGHFAPYSIMGGSPRYGTYYFAPTVPAMFFSPLSARCLVESIVEWRRPSKPRTISPPT